MYEKQIVSRDEGQRLDKYLLKLLPAASSSFLYKMLRKKNITLNDKKATGNEKLVQGDSIKIFFSNETLEKFMGKSLSEKVSAEQTYISYELSSKYRRKDIEIVYEDEHFLFLNKPVGMLAQKAKESDYSVNDWILDYLFDSKQITTEDLQSYRPSICNRLDRNTSGLILCAKSIKGAQYLTKLLKDRTIKKYYITLVHGKVDKPMTIQGYLIKNSKTNQVSISNQSKEDASYIETAYQVIFAANECSCLKVHLITGKTHQIRAHLASIGHPILGDSKYGGAIEGNFLKKYKLTNQLLHAYQIEFPEVETDKSELLSGQSFLANPPKLMSDILSDLDIHLSDLKQEG